jgi:hypothetical protein
MKSGWLAPLVLSCVACSAAIQTRPGAPEGPPEAHRKVIAAVDAMFSAMREHDEVGLRSLVAEGAIIVRLGRNEAGENTHAVIPAEAFIAGTAGGEAVIDERFVATPEVRIDGEMATLWGVYDVRVDGEFKHCGVDAVQLAHLEGRWQVTAITYTAHSDRCEARPA